MNKNMISHQESLHGAILSDHNRKSKIDLTIPMQTHLTETVRLGKFPAAYGYQIAIKIIYDCLGILISSNSKKEIGDAYTFSPNLNHLARLLYYEIKSSFLDIINDTFKIDHIRDYQDFDFFILCFVDKIDNYKGRFYILPKNFICDNSSIFKLSAMNNTKYDNQKNQNVDKQLRIKKEIVYDFFEKNNLAPTSNYEDVVRLLCTRQLHETVSKNLNPSSEQIRFNINGNIIQGKTNEDTWVNLANYIGPLNSEKYFPSFWLSTQPSKYHIVRLNIGNHWLDSNISVHEAGRIIKWGNQKTGFDIKLA